MPKRIPSWKVEIADIAHKGSWGLMGRPVRMGNFYYKTRDFQISPWETTQELAWWPQDELRGYTTQVRDIPTNTICAEDDDYQAGWGIYSNLIMGVSLGLGGVAEDMRASTVLPPGGDRNNQIAINRHVVDVPDDMYWAASSTSVPVTLGGNGGPNLPAIPCFAVVFYNFKSGDDDPARDLDNNCGACYRPVPRHAKHIGISWGGSWYLTILFAQKGEKPFAQSAKAFLTYYREGKVWSINLEGWTVPQQSLTEATWIGGDLAVCIAEINGRLAIFWNGDYENAPSEQIIVPRTKVPDLDEALPGVTELPPAPMSDNNRFDTPSSPLYIHGDGIACQFSVHGIDFEPTGWVQEHYRIYPRGKDVEVASCEPITYIPEYDAGAAVNMAVADVPVAPGERPLKLITCQIIKNAAQACRASPLLAGYVVNQPGDWTEPAAADWFDISQGVTRIAESGAEPLSLGVAEIVVDLDKALLDNLCSGWEDVLGLSVPIRVFMGWDGEVHCRLDGYIYSKKPTQTAYNEQRIQLVCRDPMMLTQKPAGLVDFQFFPLDMYATAWEQPAHGWEALKELLRTTWGDNLANRLYVVQPDSHHNLHSALPYERGMSFIGPLGVAWPPPWGDYLFNWLKDVATYDGCVLYVRPYTPDGGITWYNVPYYVEWNEMRKAEYEGVIWGTRYCYDRLYPDTGDGLGGSVAVVGSRVEEYDSHISEAEAHWRLEEAINVIEVWGRIQDSPYPVSFYYFEDPRITDPTAPNFVGWVQKLVYEASFPCDKWLGQRIGSALGQRFFNRRPARIKYKTLGQPTWWWGDVVVPSGDQLGVEEDSMRIVRMNSVIDCSALTYVTQVDLIEEPGEEQ